MIAPVCDVWADTKCAAGTCVHRSPAGALVHWLHSIGGSGNPYLLKVARAAADDAEAANALRRAGVTLGATGAGVQVQANTRGVYVLGDFPGIPGRYGRQVGWRGMARIARAGNQAMIETAQEVLDMGKAKATKQAKAVGPKEAQLRKQRTAAAPAPKPKRPDTPERKAARDALAVQLAEAKAEGAAKRAARKAAKSTGSKAAARPLAELGKSTSGPDLRVAVYAQGSTDTWHLVVPGADGKAMQARCGAGVLQAPTATARVFKAVAATSGYCGSCLAARKAELQAAKVPVWTLPKGASQPSSLAALIKQQAA